MTELQSQQATIDNLLQACDGLQKHVERLTKIVVSLEKRVRELEDADAVQ